MKQKHAAYQVVPYPKMRRLEALAYRSVQQKPMIHGLIEVDVTRARARLREHKATTGELTRVGFSGEEQVGGKHEQDMLCSPISIS